MPASTALSILPRIHYVYRLQRTTQQMAATSQVKGYKMEIFRKRKTKTSGFSIK